MDLSKFKSQNHSTRLYSLPCSSNNPVLDAYQSQTPLILPFFTERLPGCRSPCFQIKPRRVLRRSIYPVVNSFLTFSNASTIYFMLNSEELSAYFQTICRFSSKTETRIPSERRSDILVNGPIPGPSHLAPTGACSKFVPPKYQLFSLIYDNSLIIYIPSFINDFAFVKKLGSSFIELMYQHNVPSFQINSNKMYWDLRELFYQQISQSITVGAGILVFYFTSLRIATQFGVFISLQKGWGLETLSISF